MKNIKRTIVIVAVLVMVMANGITAFASTNVYDYGRKARNGFDRINSIAEEYVEVAREEGIEETDLSVETAYWKVRTGVYHYEMIFTICEVDIIEYHFYYDFNSNKCTKEYYKLNGERVTSEEINALFVDVTM